MAIKDLLQLVSEKVGSLMADIVKLVMKIFYEKYFNFYTLTSIDTS